MQIRNLTPDDLPQASTLCLDAFMQAVAPSLSAQGIETFTKVVAPQAFAERMRGDNLMLACVAQGALTGLIELKEGRHVAMLFIAPGWQRQGIGTRLMNAALEHARVDVVTVKASLSSVPAYQHYGFTLAGEVGEFAGLLYQPMEKRLPTV
ncbi:MULTISPECIES: GNAT family N-acetyltransferase [Pseudomonas]|jgi:GNAT superfamily N-acetyltransferase|uniref:Acetyltransferase n=1 Tax=Pseudomonas putida NBRC 14164 TaxID=1211579 RepID=A0ABM7EH94_PSEPU|nr:MULTISPECIES: GNAT family N-acetyltransferase [Pseudomonas]EKT4464411.1 GNAT family N-acetyltransferase [Pseudomonas putida]ELF6206045.1 GNAT family N-acetyltransferase [Pseudomonas putida]MCI1040936.1 GNAT family N-acetyltransferase [Pseudomonas putida]MCX9139873.1 GNAT family N-acetyltransferase [Pseudomonas sp. DCB_PUT]MDD1974091.1 GNAT family N-acetyltransferase [Pseudomonas putida]